mmetsp:Transcript_2071/g.5461  ORF Transcript_2071/g.5461 Transcript_2071/m.5461 type:complete len:137 (+) Transcript_2071:1347-1757(+)
MTATKLEPSHLRKAGPDLTAVTSPRPTMPQPTDDTPPPSGEAREGAVASDGDAADDMASPTPPTTDDPRTSLRVLTPEDNDEALAEADEGVESSPFRQGEARRAGSATTAVAEAASRWSGREVKMNADAPGGSAER